MRSAIFIIIPAIVLVVLLCVNRAVSSHHPTTPLSKPDGITAYVTNTPVCPGSCNGAAFLTVTGGSAPYTYSWSNGATAQNLLNLCQGLYWVTITDAAGDTEVVGASISAHQPVAVTGTVTQPGCGSPCSGSILLDVTGGGSATYTYLWSDGSTVKNRVAMCSGTYTVTATSTAGCTGTATFALSSSSAIGCAVTGDDTIPTGGTAQLCAIAGAASYAWSSGESTQCITTASPGTYTVTIADASGCTASCSKTVTLTSGIGGGTPAPCVITVNPAAGAYTGGIATNIYLGYGPQSVTLGVTVNGGSGPFTFAWTGSYLSCATCPTPVFAPTAAGTYDVAVTVTGSNGFAATCSVTFCVKDVLDPNNNSNGNNIKVLLCHVPPGNPANAHVISVSLNAVPAHIGNHAGDHLGPCGSCPDPTNPLLPGIMFNNVQQIHDDHHVHVYPNPFTDHAVIEFSLTSDQTAVLEIYNTTGVKIAELFNGPAHSDHAHEVSINAAAWPHGVYIYRLKTATDVYTGSLVRIK